MIPLVFMVAIGMMKEIIADIKRNNNDKTQNAISCKRLLQNKTGEIEEQVVRSDEI
jgi:magnesium-transporting ATPase (P-type)